MDIYKTTTMANAIKKMYPVALFFRNRYFETDNNKDIFPTQQVLVEYKKGGRTLAPFVIPRVGGIAVERNGFQAHLIKPPYIAPFKPLHIDELNEVGFGESLFTDKDADQREAELLAEDLDELNTSIDRREEWMCCELITKGEIIMRHYADKYGVGEYKEKVLRFYDNTFENQYTPAHKWGNEGANVYEDLSAMISLMTKKGNPVSDLILGSDAYDKFITDPTIQKLLDNRRMEMGKLEAVETPDGVQYMGQFVVKGKILNIFCYEEVYEDTDGKLKAFIPSGAVIMIAPKMGRMLYGAITQIEQSDHQTHTYREKKVPHYYADAKTGVREIRVSSAPVPVPKDVEAWIFADVAGGN